MRLLPLLALVACVAPAGAQVQVRALPSAGYDVGFGAPTVGLGVEVGWRPPGLPIRLAVRPSAEALLDGPDVDESQFPHGAFGARSVGRRREGLFRVGAEAVAGWGRGAVSPYLTAGVVGELQRSRTPDTQTDGVERGVTLGAGLAVRRAFVEGALGVGEVSPSRLRVGLRL